MAEQLERELRALRRELAFPPEPELADRVGELLRAEPAPRRTRPVARRPLAVALAVLLVALAAALAVPPVRGAILDLLGIGGVTIERVEELPPIAPSRDLDLGRRTELADARRSVEFPVLVPSEEELGAPDAAFVSRSLPGGAVSLLYGTERDVRALVMQFRGDSAEPGLVKKTLADATTIREVSVRGHRGFFIAGAPHGVLFLDAEGVIREDRYRLAENVLLWVEDGVTVRLEGGFGLERALRIARSLR